VTVEICDLGTWGATTLAAEYDAECDAIRVNARAVERVRVALGDAAAAAFIDCAVAHERFHQSHPNASEAEAHAFARARAGTDPHAFEAVLR
jgi:hypothetical protein